MHAYSDEDSVKVLKKCREAISSKEEGEVIVIDMVIGKKNEKHEMTEAKLFFDMLMMVLVNGREREREREKKKNGRSSSWKLDSLVTR